MKTPLQPDSKETMPKGVPPQQIANVLELQRALQPQPAALRRAPFGAMRLDPASRQSAAGSEVKPAVMFLEFAKLGLQQVIEPGMDDAWPQVVATLDLHAALARPGDPARGDKDGRPDWIELLCLARVGTRYVVVPVVFEETLDEVTLKDPGRGSEPVGLALEPVSQPAVTAAQLRAAIDKEQVQGAVTPSGAGVYLALVFDVPVTGDAA